MSETDTPRTYGLGKWTLEEVPSVFNGPITSDLIAHIKELTERLETWNKIARGAAEQTMTTEDYVLGLVREAAQGLLVPFHADETEPCVPAGLWWEARDEIEKAEAKLQAAERVVEAARQIRGQEDSQGWVSYVHGHWDLLQALAAYDKEQTKI